MCHVAGGESAGSHDRVFQTCLFIHSRCLQISYKVECSDLCLLKSCFNVNPPVQTGLSEVPHLQRTIGRPRWTVGDGMVKDTLVYLFVWCRELYVNLHCGPTIWGKNWEPWRPAEKQKLMLLVMNTHLHSDYSHTLTNVQLDKNRFIQIKTQPSLNTPISWHKQGK